MNQRVIGRRDFLKYPLGIGLGIGLGTLASDAIAQTEQSPKNASRTFIDVLTRNLYNTSKVSFRDGAYRVRTEGINASNAEQAVRADFFTSAYTPRGYKKPELLVVGVEIRAAETPTRRYRFENVGLGDMPTYVIEITPDDKETRSLVRDLPIPLQIAHGKEYARVLSMLSKYLGSNPAQVEHKK